MDEASTQSGSDILDHVSIFAKNKWLVVAIPFGTAFLALIFTYLLPNIYTATSRVLPPQQNPASTASMLGQTGALAAIAPAIWLKSPSDLYVGLLRSRTVADGLIDRFKLKNVYGVDSPTSVRQTLESRTRIVVGKEGLVSIHVDDESPMLAANLANGYIDELYKLTSALAVTEAAQRRLFFEQQLMKAKDSVTSAEAALKSTQIATGLVRVDDQTKAIIENVAKLRAMIAVREVELSSREAFSTTRNPDYVRSVEELRALKRQLAKLEKENPEAGILIPVGKIPESGLEYIRKARELKYHETIFEILARQFEYAKLDEAKDSSVVQVVDRAVLPDRRSKPRRLLITVIAFLAGVVGMLALLYSKEAIAQARGDPDRSAKLARIAGYLRWRRTRIA
jgi:uncharacterized protein involved in exopolysaccharide biosynthesis